MILTEIQADGTEKVLDAGKDKNAAESEGLMMRIMHRDLENRC